VRARVPPLRATPSLLLVRVVPRARLSIAPRALPDSLSTQTPAWASPLARDFLGAEPRFLNRLLSFASDESEGITFVSVGFLFPFYVRFSFPSNSGFRLVPVFPIIVFLFFSE